MYKPADVFKRELPSERAHSPEQRARQLRAIVIGGLLTSAGRSLGHTFHASNQGIRRVASMASDAYERYRCQRNRRAIEHQLGGLSDRLLNDIGVARSGIREAVNGRLEACRRQRTVVVRRLERLAENGADRRDDTHDWPRAA